MEFFHYTGEPLKFDRARQYEQHKPSEFGKPNGFWVSVLGDDDWPTWCRENEFHHAGLAHAHRVTIAPDANLVRIMSPEGIDGLHETFAVETDMARKHPATFGRDSWAIDWARVARYYHGIVIAPYQWSRRMSPDWYYGWDCASGCVWNLAAIDVAAAEIFSESAEKNPSNA